MQHPTGDVPVTVFEGDDGTTIHDGAGRGTNQAAENNTRLILPLLPVTEVSCALFPRASDIFAAEVYRKVNFAALPLCLRSTSYLNGPVHVHPPRCAPWRLAVAVQ